MAVAGELAQRLPEAFAPDECLGLLRAAGDDAPPGAPAALRLRLILAGQLARAGKYEDALQEVASVATKALPGSPEQMSALLTRAQSLELTQNTAGAVQAYKEIIQGYQHGMPAASIDFLRTALNNLAYTLVTAEPPVYAPAEARTYVERLQALMGPNDATATMLDTVGWVYFKNADLAQAAAALEEAISLTGPTATTALHLADVYVAQKRDSDARDVLNRALQVARDRERADEIEQLEARLKELR
jgi:tetratricopeptide (TPR) repeat protein